MNWFMLANELIQYSRNTSIATAVNIQKIFKISTLISIFEVFTKSIIIPTKILINITYPTYLFYIKAYIT